MEAQRKTQNLISFPVTDKEASETHVAVMAPVVKNAVAPLLMTSVDSDKTPFQSTSTADSQALDLVLFVEVEDEFSNDEIEILDNIIVGIDEESGSPAQENSELNFVLSQIKHDKIDSAAKVKPTTQDKSSETDDNSELLMSKLLSLEENICQLAIDNEETSKKLKHYTRNQTTQGESLKKLEKEQYNEVSGLKTFCNKSHAAVESEILKFKTAISEQVKQFESSFQAKMEEHKAQIAVQIEQMKANIVKGFQCSPIEEEACLLVKNSFDSAQTELKYRCIELKAAQGKAEYWKECCARKDQILAEKREEQAKKYQKLQQALDMKGVEIKVLRKRLDAKFN